MTSKTAKILSVTFLASILTIAVSLGGISGVDAVSDNASLTAQEKESIPKSIKFHEVKNINGLDAQEKIKKHQKFTIDFKGEQIELQVWEFDLVSPDAQAFISDEDGNKI